MKNFIILLFLLCSLNVKAENWLNHSKILQASKEAHSLKADCERISNEKCYDLGNYPSSIFSEIDVEEDDYTKPNYSKSEIQSCASIEECDLIHASKTCADAEESSIKNYDLLQVYCSKFLSYDKKLVKSIALGSVKLAAYNADLAAKAIVAQKEAAIAYAQKVMACGQRVIAYMLVRNQPKVLTTAQVDQMVQTYAPIKSLLETGSLNTAKEKIALVSADGTIVTEADKEALISEIDSCK